MWNTPDSGYLIELRHRCPGLSFAASITLSHMLGTVDPRLDSVQPHADNGSAISQPCRIGSARPLEVRGLDDAGRELREASLVERAADAAPDG